MRKVVTGVIASAALLGAGVLAPAAQAAPCDGLDMEQPFLAWHDSADYALVPGGDFEAGTTGWTLDGGAATAAGGNPFRAQSSATSLSLPAGSSATTPPVCVAKGNPTARIFANTVAPGAKKSGLKVEVLYLNADGSVRKVKKAGKLKREPQWDATRKFSLAQGQFGQAKPDGEPGPPEGVTPGAPEDKPDKPDKPQSGDGQKPSGGTAQIALRFTPTSGSAWLIDDVFVDPRMRR